MTSCTRVHATRFWSGRLTCTWERTVRVGTANQHVYNRPFSIASSNSPGVIFRTARLRRAFANSDRKRRRISRVILLPAMASPLGVSMDSSPPLSVLRVLAFPGLHRECQVILNGSLFSPCRACRAFLVCPTCLLIISRHEMQAERATATKLLAVSVPRSS